MTDIVFNKSAKLKEANMATESDGSGMGVVIGILLAIVIAIGAYFIIQNNGGVGGSKTSIDMPDVHITAPAPKE